MSEKFEHKVQQMLGNIELEPGEMVWQNVRSEIAPRRSKRRFIFWWLLPVGLAGAGLIYYFTLTDNKITSNKQQNQDKIASGTPQQSNILNELDAKKLPGKRDTGGREETISSVIAKNNINNKRNNSRFTLNKKTSSQTTRLSATDDAIFSDSDQPTGAVTEVNPSNLADTSVKVAVQDKNPKIQQNENNKVADTSAPVPVISVIAQKTKKWQFGIVAEVGGVTVLKQSSTPLFLNTGSFSSPTTIGSGATIVTLQQQPKPGAGFSAGFTAKRRLNKNFDFITSLLYTNQAFSIRSGWYKDSANIRNVLYQSTESYTMQYLNLAIGATGYFYNRNNTRLGADAFIDNMYLLAADHRIATVDYSSNANATFQKSRSLSSYNKWQPAIRFGLVASFSTNNKTVIQLSPYIGYALGSFDKKNNSHLLNFGLSTRYYFGR